MKADWIELKVTDGTLMKVYVAQAERPTETLFPEASRRPTLIVLQEAFGVNDHIQDVTRRFADLGFIAAAPELFHRTGEHVQAAYNNLAAMLPHMQAMTDEGLTNDLEAVADYFSDLENADAARMATIGYCMGGRAAFLANTVLKLKCAVSYYGSRIAPGLLARTPLSKGPLLFFWGGKDAHIGNDQKQAIIEDLKRTNKHFINVEFGDADHGFYCDQKAAYHKESALMSLHMVKEFFKNHV